MIFLNGQIDILDFEHMYRLRKEDPVAVMPCPRSLDGRINPHVTRFFWKNGQMGSVFHIKPIYYENLDGKWYPMSEVAYGFGNRWIQLKEDCMDRMTPRFLMWLENRMAQLKGKIEITTPYIGRVLQPYEMAWNTTLTAFPVVGTGTAPMDAHIFRSGIDEIFGTIRGGAGTTVNATDTDPNGGLLQGSTTTDQYQRMDRYGFGFDTSSIGSDTIDDATISLDDGGNSQDTALGDTDINITSFAPSDEATLATGDFAVANWGSTAFSTDINISAIGTGYNDFVLNASGEADISTAGNTYFGARLDWDIDNSFGGTWASAATTRANWKSADTADTTSDPRLVVNHTSSVTHRFGGPTGAAFSGGVAHL